LVPVRNLIWRAALLLMGLSLPLCVRAAAPVVVASVAPLHSLVAAVMQGVGSPHLLLRGGESPHTFSLRPSDARLLHAAQVLFWIGPALDLPLQRLLPGLEDTDTLAMLDLPGIQTLAARDLDPAHAAGSTGEHAVDPHIWLSPANATAMGDAIAQTLATVDAPNATRYRENAVRLRQRLSVLDRDLKLQLSRVDGGFVVFHDAYQYLEQRYDLRSSGTVTTHPERSPGAGHLSALRERLAADHVRCLFSEPEYQPRLVEMLTEGMDIRHLVLDPLGAEIPPGPDAYEQMMRTLVDRVSGCLGGAKP
jgi:zinc transport system substrate-binding protein